MSFQLVEDGDFSLASAGKGLCYVTGETKQPGDRGIFRGPTIEYEGFLDVSLRCITNAASELGWRSADDYGDLARNYEKSINSYHELMKQYEAVKERLEVLEAELGPEPEGDHACPFCDYQGSSKQGLLIHKSKMHPVT